LTDLGDATEFIETAPIGEAKRTFTSGRQHVQFNAEFLTRSLQERTLSPLLAQLAAFAQDPAMLQKIRGENTKKCSTFLDRRGELPRRKREQFLFFATFTPIACECIKLSIALPGIE
jgi:hypothetical protein